VAAEMEDGRFAVKTERETPPRSYKKITFEHAANFLIVGLFVFSREKSHQGGRHLFGCVARYLNTY